MTKITLAHGGGGRLQNELIRQEIASRFANSILSPLPDGAVTPEGLVISSDSFVITPRFFPGGNIGKLAVVGSVNDVLMAGGIPQYMTCSLILEEGLDLEELQQILDAMSQAAKECNVLIVTGDTKVVPSGSGDGVYINTTAVGFKRAGLDLDCNRIGPGDKIIVSRSIGEHGLAVLASRYDLQSDALQSDCAALNQAVETLIAQCNKGGDLKFMRDATRGGVLGIISEIFENTTCNAVIEESALPVSPAAAAIGRMLGIEPGFAACEGCMAAVVAADCAEQCVEALRTLPGCGAAAIIGEAAAGSGMVEMASEWGSRRKLIVPAGDQLPRIC